jgi:hypothetical protein
MKNDKGPGGLVISYLTLRWVVGLLGMLLPLLLAIGAMILFSATALEDSISDYYGTGMRDVFVGVLCAIGCFLLTYKGHEKKDNVAGNLACAFALGVAFFPATSSSAWVRAVHFSSAAALFVTLSYFSLFLFTKTSEDASPTPRKVIRNRIYVGCGVAMLVCIGLIGVYYLFDVTSLATIKPVFWLESAALLAFGVSWFVKGETLLKDEDPE